MSVSEGGLTRALKELLFYLWKQHVIVGFLLSFSLSYVSKGRKREKDNQQGTPQSHAVSTRMGVYNLQS
jgi:hypothetical protein